MEYKSLQKLTRNGALALGLAVAAVLPVAAQQSNNANNSNTRVENTTRVVERDNDTDWGWLGLLGLLGLAGLLPKKRQVEVQQFRDVRTDQTGTGTGTTPGAGTNR